VIVFHALIVQNKRLIHSSPAQIDKLKGFVDNSAFEMYNELQTEIVLII